MVEREDYEQRMSRLRQATQDIEPPVGFVSRVMRGIDQRSSEPSFWEAIRIVGPFALVPAACTSAAVAVLVNLHGSWLEDALLVASSVGWMP